MSRNVVRKPSITLPILLIAAGFAAAAALHGGAPPLAASGAPAGQSGGPMPHMPGMAGMPGMPGMAGTPAMPERVPGPDAAPPQGPPEGMEAPGMGGATAAGNGMDHEHMGMGPHMRWTSSRPRSAADERRAEAIVEALRGAIARYSDYHAAIADHFIEFMPNIRQPMYHFTNYRYAREAHSRFDPARPTSLLYKPTADGFQLIGAMYTAPQGFDESQLDARVPLSVAAWHQHVNVCLPPRADEAQADWTRFGFHGAIATAAECQASGGEFHPVIFGWMVHVYPFEKDPARIWAH